MSLVWVEGDTDGDVSFVFTDVDKKAPVDFTGRTVRIALTRLSDNVSFYADLVVSDPASGSGVVPKRLLPCPAGQYAVEALEKTGDGLQVLDPTAGPLTAIVRARATMPEPT